MHIRDAGSLGDTMILEDDRDGLVSLAFSPQGTILATGGGNPLEVLQQPTGKGSPREDQARPVRLWDAKTGSPLRSLTGHMGSIHALVFNAEGTRLVSAGADGLIRVWDTGDGHLIRKLEGHSKPIHALALSPDGRQLASAGADGSIKIWELSEGRLIRTLTGHTNWIFGLAFHPTEPGSPRRAAMAPCVSGSLPAAGKSSFSAATTTASTAWPSAPTARAWPRPPPTALSESGRQSWIRRVEQPRLPAWPLGALASRELDMLQNATIFGFSPPAKTS